MGIERSGLDGLILKNSNPNFMWPFEKYQFSSKYETLGKFGLLFVSTFGCAVYNMCHLGEFMISFHFNCKNEEIEDQERKEIKIELEVLS